MGWSGYPGKSRDEAIKAHLEDVKVIRRTPLVKGGGYDGHFWLLAKSYRTGEPLIVCVIVDGYALKDVDESMGPVYYDVPVAWLDEAPVAPGPFARPWRDKVYRYWGERVSA